MSLPRSRLFLAVGGLYAYKTFKLASMERAEIRDYQRRQPHRELVMDVVRELKYLSQHVETVMPGVGYHDISQTQAHLRRLQITLSVLPANDLPSTRALATKRDLIRQV